MSHKTPIAELFNKYLEGTIRPAELTELLQYIERSEAGDELTPLIQRELGEQGADYPSLKALVDRVEAKVFADTAPTAQSGITSRLSHFSLKRTWVRYAAVAAVVIALGLGWLVIRTSIETGGTSASIETDIAPGTNRATLTLADGRKVDLNTAQNGIVVGEKITYLDGTEVSAIDHPAPDVPQPLSLTTPKGGTYQVTLPDGTNVWLNSASTLTYPSRFDDNERVVELVGEAYFEVRSTRYGERSTRYEVRGTGNEVRGAWPFRVVSNGQVVEVLGTEFNVSAYSDDPEMKTTLVEGRLRVFTGKTQGSILVPGQQLTNRNGAVQIATVDVGNYIAWKQGQFVFYGTSMPTLIKQIERWYDVSFYVTVPVDNIELWGSLSRDVMLSEILHVIELNTPLKFTQEGRHVMVHR